MYFPLNITKCDKLVDMREKPVPVRVDKELQPLETSMDAIKEETNFEKEISDDVNSRELPSMVSVMPMDSKESPSKYNTRLYQTYQAAIECRPSLDIPGEFEFLNSDSISESQKQAIKFGVRVFRDWLHKQGVQFQSLQDMSRSEIANALEQFYMTARRPNGSQYKKNTLKSIKHSLDHYLRASAFKKDFSISTDYDFRQVNKTLDNLPEDADQNRFPQFTKEIILKLYKSGQLGLTTTEDANIIIQTVWFYIVAYFFTNIDKRMLRELKESNLILAKDEEDREYYWLDFKPPERIRGEVDKSRIYARPGSLCCPVAIIKKYMEHRNPRNDVLFQHPKRITPVVWYSPLPLGKNKHTDLMKSMCLNAGVEPPLTGRCVRSYVQQLLQDCDGAVNEMFRPEIPASSVAMHGVLLPKFPGDINPSLVPPFILSVPQLPPPILSTTLSTVSTTENNNVPIQPRVTATSGDHVGTSVTNQGAITTSNTTQNTNATTSQYGKRLTIQSNHIITSPISPITTVGTFPTGFVLPYPTSFPSIHDFSKPKESYNASQSNTPHNGTKGATYELSAHYFGTTSRSNSSPIVNAITAPPSETSIGNKVETIFGTTTSQSIVQNSVIPSVPLQQTAQKANESSTSDSLTFTAEIATQTESANKQWLESAYHKADLKTRNKMRLQARKSLLCFLEELNEISDGHGTELFYEIVEEDTNMWKSITKPASSK